MRTTALNEFLVIYLFFALPLKMKKIKDMGNKDKAPSSFQTFEIIQIVQYSSRGLSIY